MSKFRWEQGGAATLERLDGDFATFISTTASPPGRPLAALTDDGERFQVKVRGCVRLEQADERYRIEGKFFNLTRDQRRRLQERFADPAAVPGDSDQE